MLITGSGPLSIGNKDQGMRESIGAFANRIVMDFNMVDHHDHHGGFIFRHLILTPHFITHSGAGRTVRVWAQLEPVCSPRWQSGGWDNRHQGVCWMENPIPPTNPIHHHQYKAHDLLSFDISQLCFTISHSLPSTIRFLYLKVTGQNPQSSIKTAELVIRALSS